MKRNPGKRILFINPWIQSRLKNKKIRPVGLAYILTAVRKAGIEFEFLDMYANETTLPQLRKYLDKNYFDIIAFGCIVTALNLVAELASILREANPQTKILAGNSIASAIPRLLLNHTEVDFAVIGEGEVTVVQLLQALLKGKPIENIRGIAYRKEGRIYQNPTQQWIGNINSIGFPEWDFFENRKYNEGYFQMSSKYGQEFRPFPLSSARGCPYHCTFCYHVFKNQPYRRCSEHSIVQEFRRLHYNYDANFIQFSDELSFPNIASLTRLVRQIERLPFQICWSIVICSNLFRKKDIPLIQRMKEAGCFSICFALENTDSTILRAMGKKVRVEDCIEQIETLQEGGLAFGTSLIFGYPQETLKSIQDTFDLCERFGIVPGVGFLQPLPQTPIYDWALKMGYIRDEWEYLMQAGDREVLHVNLTQISTPEFIEAVVRNVYRLARKQGLECQCQFLQLLNEYQWTKQPYSPRP